MRVRSTVCPLCFVIRLTLGAAGTEGSSSFSSSTSSLGSSFCILKLVTSASQNVWRAICKHKSPLNPWETDSFEEKPTQLPNFPPSALEGRIDGTGDGCGSTCYKNGAKQQQKLSLFGVREADGGQVGEDLLTLLVVHVFKENKRGGEVMHQSLNIDGVKASVLQLRVSSVIVNAIHKMVKYVGQGERTDRLAHLP